jgi:hypothetical protein
MDSGGLSVGITVLDVPGSANRVRTNTSSHANALVAENQSESMTWYLSFQDKEKERQYTRFRNSLIMPRQYNLYFIMAFVFTLAGVSNFLVNFDEVFSTLHSMLDFVMAAVSLFGGLLVRVALPPDTQPDRRANKQAQLQYYAIFLACVYGIIVLVMVADELKETADCEKERFPIATIFYYLPLFPTAVLVSKTGVRIL